MTTSITVNKRKIEYVEDEKVTDLLARLKYKFSLIHVSINGELIPREKYEETPIPVDAVVSVIHMISGG